MLTDLNQIQDESDETVYRTELSIAIETRNSTADTLVERVYTFSYAVEWDKWVLHEYVERETTDTVDVTEREWERTEHLFWTDVNDTRSIEVPSAVSEKLAAATGAETVTIQVPRGTSVNSSENEYEVVSTVE